MRPGLKFNLKRLVSVLVCVMMVAATFPFHVLNSSVFADEDGNVIHISQNSLSSGLEKILNSDENKINIILDSNIEISPDSSGMSDECFFDFKDSEKFSKKTINITSNKNKKDFPFEIKNKSEKMSLLAAKGCSVVLENVLLDGGSVEGTGNFIDLSFDATLIIKEGAIVRNVKRAGESSAIALNYSSKLLLDGGSVCGFCGAKGSAISANNDSSVNMYKNSSVTKCTTGGYGGAISVVLDSNLNLLGGHISECAAVWRGDAVFFDSCGEFKVAPPNGDLKISIPESFDNSHNSDARVVGYVGIYKSGVDIKVSDNKQHCYYEAKLDADGGTFDDGFEPGNLLLVPRKDADGGETSNQPLLNYLPKDLKRDEIFVSGWIYDDGVEKQLENETKIGEIFPNLNAAVKLTAKYEIEDVEVSEYSDLKHAVANLGDNCKITLKADMQIDDTICVGGNKNVLIEAPEDEPHTLTVAPDSNFLTATENSNVTLKNINLYGGAGEDFDLKGGNSSSETLVDVRLGAKLTLVNCNFDNYEMTGENRIIVVQGGTLKLFNCCFEKCGVKNDGDAFGGVVKASGPSNVSLNDCIIKDCYAWSVNGDAKGGAIYWNCKGLTDGATAKLKISGGQITGCYAYSGQGGRAFGDCIYLCEEGKFSDNLGFDESRPTKILIDKSLGNVGHNSWFGYIGYAGIYKEGVPAEKLSDPEKETELVESTGLETSNIVLEIDCRGGVDLDGDEPNEMLCIPGVDVSISEYLPKFLKKDGVLISGWKYGSGGTLKDIDSGTTLNDVLVDPETGKYIENVKIVAEYEKQSLVKIDASNENKSPYQQLQEAIYNAKGTVIIELAESIEIGDSDAYPLVGVVNDIANDEGLEKYCFIDNKNNLSKEIIIRGKEGADVSITLNRSDLENIDLPDGTALNINDAGLIALQSGILTLENITLSYVNESVSRIHYIDVSGSSILNLNEGAKIKDFAGLGVNAIHLDKSTLNINPGSEISNCVITRAGRQRDGGSAIFALGGSVVNVCGLIKGCHLATGEGLAAELEGGAIYALDSSVNVMDGGSIEECYCSVFAGGARGGAIAAEGSKVHMSGGLISDCRCQCQDEIFSNINGGAISIRGQAGMFIMTGGTIEGCYCYFEGPPVDLLGLSDYYVSGGAICVSDEDGDASLFLKSGKIVDCYVKAEGETDSNYEDTNGNHIVCGDAVYFKGAGEFSVALPRADLIIGIDSEEGNQALHNIGVNYDGYPGIWREVSDDDIKFYEIAINADGGKYFDGRNCDDKLAIPIKDSSGAETLTNSIYTYLPKDLKKDGVWVSGWKYKDKDENFVDITEQTTVEEVLDAEEPSVKAVYDSPDQKIDSVEAFLNAISSRLKGKGYENKICLSENLDLSKLEGPPISLEEEETLIFEGEGDEPIVIVIDPNSPFLNIVNSGKVILRNVIIKGMGALSEGPVGGATDSEVKAPIILSDGAIFEIQNGAGFEDLKTRDCPIIKASNGSKVFLSGGLIKNCECISDKKDVKGGFIGLSNESILKVIGTKIENCSCSSTKSAYGGFAYLAKYSSIFIKDCDIRNCYCRCDMRDSEKGKAYGGFIYSSNSKVNIVSGTVSGCEVSTYSHNGPDLKGDVIYFKGNSDELRICPPNDALKMTVPLHSNSHNSDAKIWGYWGIYFHDVLLPKSDASNFKYYEIPIDAAGSVDRDQDQNANSVYVDKSNVDEPMLKYLPTNDRVRASDGAVISGWETQDGMKIEETTTVRDILPDGSNQTKKLRPIYSDKKFRVSSYIQLQKVILKASGDVTIALDCDIEILDNDDYPLAKHSLDLNCCFADQGLNKKNIVIESADEKDPKKITNKKENARLFVFRNGSLTFKNIILDGGAVYDRAPSEKMDYGFEVGEDCVLGTTDFILISNAKLNLDSGAVIQNVYRVVDSAGVIHQFDGSEININEGSKIVDCCIDVEDGVVCGCAISSFKGSTVNMNGGLIIGCVINNGSMDEEDCAYGAAMYVDESSSLNIKSGNILRCGVKCGYNDSAKGDAIYFSNSNLAKYNVIGPNQSFKIEIPFFDNEPHNTSAHVAGYRGIFIKHSNTHAIRYYELRLRPDDAEYFLDQLYYGYSFGSGSGSGSAYVSNYPIIAYVYVEIDKMNDLVKKYLPSSIDPDGRPIISWRYDVNDKNADGILVGDKTTIKDVLKKETSAELWFDCYEKEEHVNSYKQLQNAIYKAKAEKTIILDNDIIFWEDEEFPDALDVKEKYGFSQSYPTAEPGCCFSDDLYVRQIITIKSAEGKTCTIQSKKPGSIVFAIRNGVLKLENVTVDGGAIYKENGDADFACLRRMVNFINISNKSLLEIGQGATIQNVYRECEKCHAIYLKNEGGVRIKGGLITGCKNINNNCDYKNFGGAICATDISSVEMNDGSITKCSVISKSNACGGAIYIGPTSKLVLEGGTISDCLSSYRGDAIYFAGLDPKDYDVALPGHGLTITIPLTDGKNSRNSDARIVGYQGIFKVSIANKSATAKDFLYYELNVDLNGGSSAGCDPSLQAIYVSKKAGNFCVLKYLPNDLKKDGVSLTGWECDGVEIVKNATVFSFLESQNSVSTKTLKARYDKGEEHVSNYWELQHAIYHALGTKTIFLDCNIDISDDIDEIGEMIYEDAAKVTDYKGNILYPNAQKGYCLSDNHLQTNRSITIKSSGNDVFRIKNQKKKSGLLALRGGIIKFENVIIDGGGDDFARNVNFISASKYSEIVFDQGATVQNVKASAKAYVICLNESVLILKDNSFITGCFGSSAGAIYALNQSEVTLQGGKILNCSSELNGGAIFSLNSKLNLESGEILNCSAKAKGDAIYFEGNDNDYNVAKPEKDLTIRISLQDNSHNSDAKVLGYWGIYKKGVGQTEKESKHRYCEIRVVDADGGKHICSIYIDMNDMQNNGENIKIMPYLQKSLTNESDQLVKWLYNDGVEKNEVDQETTLATKHGPITVIIKKVKAENV